MKKHEIDRHRKRGGLSIDWRKRGGVVYRLEEEGRVAYRLDMPVSAVQASHSEMLFQQTRYVKDGYFSLFKSPYRVPGIKHAWTNSREYPASTYSGIVHQKTRHDTEQYHEPKQ